MRVLLVLLVLLPAVAHAVEIGGRIKLEAVARYAGGHTPDAVLGYRHSGEFAGQLRLEFSHAAGPWQMQAAWQLDARGGSAVERDNALAAVLPATAAAGMAADYWDLEDRLTDSRRSRSAQRIDRLNIGYSRRDFTVRLGRQALTWGSGRVFHPMDLVNPFQPVATDTVYKRGTDMAYAQWLFTNGSDVQFAVVPHRRDAVSGGSTRAMFANLVGPGMLWTVLLAADRAATVCGVGASGTWRGTVWNVEVVPTFTDDHGTKTSWLANLTYAPILVGRNATLFAELYHNGFGERDTPVVAELNEELVARLDRGQVFVTGRNHVALGASWEWTPLLTLEPTLMLNLEDESALIDLQLDRSLGNDTSIKAGLRLPFGSRGTAFGGLELVRGSGLYLASQQMAFVRIAHYF